MKLKHLSESCSSLAFSQFAPGGVNEVDDKGRDGEDEDQANLKKNTFVIPRIFLVP